MMKENIQDLGIKEILDLTAKTQTKKEKNGKLDLIKIKNF